MTAANETAAQIPPPTVEALKQGAKALNERIAVLRADEVDARRMMRAGEPRKPKTGQSKGGK